jgi:hypothetical protein
MTNIAELKHPAARAPIPPDTARRAITTAALGTLIGAAAAPANPIGLPLDSSRQRRAGDRGVFEHQPRLRGQRSFDRLRRRRPGRAVAALLGRTRPSRRPRMTPALTTPTCPATSTRSPKPRDVHRRLHQRPADRDRARHHNRAPRRRDAVPSRSRRRIVPQPIDAVAPADRRLEAQAGCAGVTGSVLMSVAVPKTRSGSRFTVRVMTQRRLCDRRGAGRRVVVARIRVPVHVGLGAERSCVKAAAAGEERL